MALGCTETYDDGSESVRQKALEILKKEEDERLRTIAMELAMEETAARQKEEEDYFQKTHDWEGDRLFYYNWRQPQYDPDMHIEEMPPPEEDVDDVYYHYYEDDETKLASVVGTAFDYPLITFQRFVGSLRKTGFEGHIILGIGKDTEQEILHYLNEQNVTIKTLKTIKCDFEPKKRCLHPYPSVKRDWARFALARDWLMECKECVGASLFTDVHDTYFQSNPFGKDTHVIDRLYLFEEHSYNVARLTTVGEIIRSCQHIDLGQYYPTLSVGSAVAPVDQMISFLNLVHTTMIGWMKNPACHFSHGDNDDDKAVINYLRIAKKLPPPPRTRVVPHRTGLVNTLGYEGKTIYESKMHLGLFRGLSENEAENMLYEGASGNAWLDTDYLLTDKNGYFINLDFKRSVIVHEYSVFGEVFLVWLDKFLNGTLVEEQDEEVNDKNLDDRFQLDRDKEATYNLDEKRTDHLLDELSSMLAEFEGEEFRKAIEGEVIEIGTFNGTKKTAESFSEQNNINDIKGNDDDDDAGLEKALQEINNLNNLIENEASGKKSNSSIVGDGEMNTVNEVRSKRGNGKVAPKKPVRLVHDSRNHTTISIQHVDTTHVAQKYEEVRYYKNKDVEIDGLADELSHMLAEFEGDNMERQ